MSATKVMIVDDSVAIRRVLSDVLSKRDDFRVVGSARHGRDALAKLEGIEPDVLVLDVEMPVMNGVDTLCALQKKHSELPVVMFSTETERGADITLEALTQGAKAYVPKPSEANGLAEAKETIELQLIPKLKIFSKSSDFGETDSPGSSKGDEAPAGNDKAKWGECTGRRGQGAGFRNRKIELVSVAVSTGGPDALLNLIPRLPGDFPAPIVIVQHMPSTFLEQLSSRLTANSELRVGVAEDRQSLDPGSVLFAPGGVHSEIVSRGDQLVLKTTEGPKLNHCRPSADVLFRSAAKTLGGSQLAVVMTGMGKDGFKGCKQIAESGGLVLAQDKQSSVVWGMPKHPVEHGLADWVVALDEMARQLTRIAGD